MGVVGWHFWTCDSCKNPGYVETCSTSDNVAVSWLLPVLSVAKHQPHIPFKVNVSRTETHFE